MGRRVHTLLLTAVVGLTMALALAVPAGAHPDRQVGTAEDGTVDNAKSAHGHQHGGIEGHLPPAQSNVELVGKAAVADRAPGRVADVNVFGNYAYLGAYANPNCQDGGVYVFDISDVTVPRQVGFIPTGPGTFVGEGVQIVPLRTRTFRGDVLIFNNEICSVAAGNVGGATLVDVSDPLNPQVLSSQFGDFDPPGIAPGVAHQVHSALIWTQGRSAYAVLVDDEESSDVDIFDISDPRNPVKVAEYDLAAMFPQILQAGMEEVFFHDVVVKRIGGRQVMLLSYWDAGYVKLDVTDPRQPTYLGDTDFTFPDPELLAQTGRQENPEGNAHQAEFTRDNKYVIGADEDFGPNGLEGRTDDGAAFDAVPGSDTPQLTDGQTLTGTAVYGGRACDLDPAVPSAPSVGGPYIAVVTRGLCTFTEKVANVEAAGGYAGVVVVNREGSDGCSVFGMSVEGNIPAFSVDRRTGFGFFDQEAAYVEAACRAGTASEIPGVTLGATGDVITVRAFFDGWGYVHLFANENGKISELDTYAIGEAMDPRFATGFGDLSVHEVATSQRRRALAYLSYYAGGFRVIKIENNEIQEVGRFIDQGGNNFWGVQVFRRGDVEYVAASDRDYGLYIFRYNGRG